MSIEKVCKALKGLEPAYNMTYVYQNLRFI